MIQKQWMDRVNRYNEPYTPQFGYSHLKKEKNP
ncbi:hypothetical protein PAGL106935_22400 [Paenibacillus glucanolyticus]